MKELLKRFGFEELGKQERPLLGENYAFDKASYPSAKDLTVVREDLFLEETPLAIVRQVHLQHAGRQHTTLQLTLALCWNGFGDALRLLSRFAGSFQRSIPVETALNTAERFQIGDFGVAWAWSGAGDPDVLAFVRNNVFVGLQGHDAGNLLVALAREMDGTLKGLRTTDKYAETPVEVFAAIRKRHGEIPRVPSGGRLEFGALPDTKGAFFFLTTGGSVNRDAAQPRSWYYRAGTEKRRQEVTLYWVEAGILPTKDRLTLEVI